MAANRSAEPIFRWIKPWIGSADVDLIGRADIPDEVDALPVTAASEHRD
jgi:hypothetical protein